MLVKKKKVNNSVYITANRLESDIFLHQRLQTFLFTKLTDI